MSEWPEAVVKRIAKELYISPVSDHWGETVPEISAVCERVAVIALDALGLRVSEEWGMDYGDEIDSLGDKEYALRASEEVNATIARGEDAEYAFLNAHKLVRRTILHAVTPWEDA